ELHNKISGFGEYIITNLNSKIDKDEIIFADLLCHYISELESKNYKKWFPRLYIYKNEYESFDFFIKLSSNRYFNKVKDLFNVEDLESFKTLINNYKLLIEKENRSRHTSGGWNTIPFIFESIKVDKVATER